VQAQPIGFETSGMASPEYVRVSLASAIALRFRSGRFPRPFDFGGINLLLNYPEGCRSDCAYCGLARSRPGQYGDKSFIRVEWPLLPTDEVVERMARCQGRLTRLCISMVTHVRSFMDTVDISRRILSRVDVPLSILVAPPVLNRQRLQTFRDIGVDMIGIGLDAVTEDLFGRLRTRVPAGGGLQWRNYQEIVLLSREIFGPWKVNCHTLVGLGESDADLADTFYALKDRQVFAYLFCFNPEPDSRLGDRPKSDLTRWRRIQLTKHLIEERALPREGLEFDADGNLVRLRAPREMVHEAVESGLPFMTDGCPSREGELGCSRPFGSYRPSEPFRDFPFAPDAEDLRQIWRELRLEEIWDPVPAGLQGGRIAPG
jgi:biotin synthase-related radical SAM superfamily protein